MRTIDRQRGVSLLGVLFWGGLVAFLFVIGAQVLPSVTEYMEISRAVNKARGAGTTVPEIRNAFSLQQQAGYIFAITPADLDITKDQNGEVVVSFAYQKKIPLAGPVSLVIDYEGTARKR
ncbi:hypothetical protein BH09PSE6_BH09PSE6_18410 [soil metagenome]